MNGRKPSVRVRQSITETGAGIQRDLSGEIPGWLMSEIVIGQLESSGRDSVRRCPKKSRHAPGMPLALIGGDALLYGSGGQPARPKFSGGGCVRKWFGFRVGASEFMVKRGTGGLDA